MDYKITSFLKRQADYLSSKSNDYVYDTDKEILNENEKVNSSGRGLKDGEIGKIHNTLFPVSVLGDLNKGKIVLCLLNPGFDDKDYIDEPIIREEIIKQLRQEDASMFCLKEKCKNTSAGLYWRNKFDQKDKKHSLVQSIINEYKKNGLIYVNEEIVFDMFSRLFVDLELFPYHSKRFTSKKLKELKEKGKSAGIMLSFVHDELIPNASNNNQLICFLRKVHEWEVSDKETKSNVVFINPKSNRQSCSFNPNLELGRRILQHVKLLTNNFTIVL